MSALYGEGLYGEAVYAEGEDNTPFFLRLLADGPPASYVPPESRDLWERFVRPSAEDLARTNYILDTLERYVRPESMPEAWLDWFLIEVLRWRLIPEGYPVERKQRLLKNLHAHVKRRGTVARNPARSYDTLGEQLFDPLSGEGIRLLLLEFGVHAEVIDQPLYARSYVRRRGVNGPLKVIVRVYYYEPWVSARRNYVRNYVRGLYVHRTPPGITDRFVLALCEWSRAAGVQFTVQFLFNSKYPAVTAYLYDQQVQLETTEPLSGESHVGEEPQPVPAPPRG